MTSNLKPYLKIVAAAALFIALGAQAEEKPLRIGVALSQSGNLADAAKLYFSGVELWRDQVNARGGLLGRTVELVVYDDRSDAATAAKRYDRGDRPRPPRPPALRTSTSASF